MKLLKYLLHLASRNLYVHLAVHLAWSPSSLMTNGRAPLLSTIPFSLLDHCWSYGTRWWERAESCDAPGKTRRQLKLTEPHSVQLSMGCKQPCQAPRLLPHCWWIPSGWTPTISSRHPPLSATSCCWQGQQSRCAPSIRVPLESPTNAQGPWRIRPGLLVGLACFYQLLDIPVHIQPPHIAPRQCLHLHDARVSHMQCFENSLS